MVDCPAGVCGETCPLNDPDYLLGHLLVDHNWTRETATDRVGELWRQLEAEDDE